MIDLEELIATARRGGDRGAEAAYRAVLKRVRLFMSMPGPGRDVFPSQQRLVELVREEIKGRQQANEFIRPSNSNYALNLYIISVLSKLLP